MVLRLMVLDVAGTTVRDDDHAVARCVCDALAQAGAHLPLTAVDPLMGMPKPLAIAALLADARGAEPAAAEVDSVHDDFRRRMIEHYRTSPTVAPMPHAERLFEMLRARNVRIALDTGFDRLILDTILERLAWRGVIDDSISSDEVARGRPHPDMIHVLMQRGGVTDAAHVGKVGDSVSDLEQGVGAGCGLVAAILGSRTAPAMQRFPTALGVRDLHELGELIDAHLRAGSAA